MIGRAPRIAAALSLAVGLSACTGQGAVSSPVPIDPAATGQDVAAPALPGSADMAPLAIVTLDREQMADADCHVMGESLMGRCDDAEALAEALGAAELIPVNTETMADAECHYMNGEIMGRCTAEEVAGWRYDRTIVVDPATMADEPCHAMGNTIMGRCDEADIQAQAAIIATSW